MKAPYLIRHDDPYHPVVPGSFSPCEGFGGAGCSVGRTVLPSATSTRLPQQRWTTTIRKNELGFNSLRILVRSLSGRATLLQAGAMTIPASSLRFSVGRTLGWSRL